ncbi:triose-phosphate isomerase [Candidatus Peregrinibacteria bacterium]|nr:triose-phosphate isomerase [Candidatus Peregrinibacteria bacterium]MBI3816344.1 triose-phosphate isomerase [Candidatus Peregrinibacteria bacterium]
MHRCLIAANWKMFPPPEGWDAMDSPYRATNEVDVMVFSPFVYLKTCVAAGLRTGAQCGHPEPTGAHTGCVSMAMIASTGCEAVLCGHSERRRDQGETDEFVAAQAKAALTLGLFPIVCIGETASERSSGKAHEVIERQLRIIIDHLGPSPFANRKSQIAIAYEPVWAISGGDLTKPAAKASDAQEMHAFIRSLLPESVRDDMRILYGGSMKADNAKELLSQPDIDGGLVGGASLKPEEFRAIVKFAEQMANG